MKRPSSHRHNSGFAAVTAIILVVVMGVMALTLFSLTNTEIAVGKATTDSTVGFYAAEAGLNVRGEEVRNIFVGYNRPEGNASDDCTTSKGSDDYVCKELTVSSRRVVTRAEESTCNDSDSNGVCDTSGGQLLPQTITIPQGETFGGLNAQEYTYTVASDAYSPQGDLEASLGMRFRSRLVPLFQFAAFYDQDLELGNGPEMSLGGRVHSNGTIYFGPHKKLTIDGKITTAEKFMLGRKPGDHQEGDSTCRGSVNVRQASGKFIDVSADNNCKADEISKDNLAKTGGNIKQDVPALEIPKVGVIDRDPDNKEATYWQKADLRIVLNLNAGVPIFEVRDRNDKVNAALTGLLTGGSGCTGAVDYSDTFFNRREGEHIKMLDVNMKALLTCVGKNPGFPELDDSTEGGLVMHFSVDGPDSEGINSYGVRLKKGEELNQEIEGLTVVTDQALYVQGDYNKDNKKPASLLADSLNVLSNNWCDVRDSDNNDSCLDGNSSGVKTRAAYKPYNDYYIRRDGKPKYITAQPYLDEDGNDYVGNTVSDIRRKAESTTINAAMMANVDETGNAKADRLKNTDRMGNGGLHNFPRMHERWSGRDLNGRSSNEKLTIRGSFVSLGVPRHVNGKFDCCGRVYSPPVRDWDYDTDFNVADNLPPLSPRFVILVQEVFSRDYTPSQTNDETPSTEAGY